MSAPDVVDYADAGALVVSAGVDPERIRRPSGRSWMSWFEGRDETVPADELARCRAYLAGRMELRMEETPTWPSWFGGQEALHDKVLTLEQALAELEAVTADGIRGLAERLISDEALRMAAVVVRIAADAVRRRRRD